MDVIVKGDLLKIILEEEREWSEIFEKNEGKKVRIFVDNGKFDTLFYSWKQCRDKHGVLLRIPVEDLESYKRLIIQHDFEKGGAGEYHIDSIECQIAEEKEELNHKSVWDMTPKELDYLEEIATVFVNISKLE